MQRNGNSENPSDVVIEVAVAHHDERQVAETMFTSRTFKLPQRRNAMSTLDNGTSLHAEQSDATSTLDNATSLYETIRVGFTRNTGFEYKKGKTYGDPSNGYPKIPKRAGNTKQCAPPRGRGHLRDPWKRRAHGVHRGLPSRASAPSRHRTGQSSTSCTC